MYWFILGILVAPFLYKLIYVLIGYFRYRKAIRGLCFTPAQSDAYMQIATVMIKEYPHFQDIVFMRALAVYVATIDVEMLGLIRKSQHELVYALQKFMAQIEYYSIAGIEFDVMGCLPSDLLHHISNPKLLEQIIGGQAKHDNKPRP